jgi:hypothetical protein
VCLVSLVLIMSKGGNHCEEAVIIDLENSFIEQI